ncbi:MAG TPA: protease modulator HflC [Clostridia bacterium]|jgi:membrane protease subunit HflC|nr:protease modulator HflC [Clostridiaceae bacterium]HOA30605.1 protease modulator HflC [Clostridia bacterium]HPZ52114.1 protease modulator HflC [Clostridia bacterium]
MKKKVTLTLAIVIAFILIILAASSLYTVKEDEYALILRFSKVESIKSESGLYFRIPFIETILKFPKNLQLYDLRPSDVLTSDSKAMSVDSYVLWKISDPLQFYKTLGSIAEAQVRLDASTYNALKNVIGRKEQNAIITQQDTGRDTLNEEIFQNVKNTSTGYGIEIMDVKVKRFDLPQANEEAVYRRMISDRNQIAARYLAEGQSEANMLKNEVDKKVSLLISEARVTAEELIAEGEAEYMRLLAETFDTKEKQDFYIFMRSLEALKASLTGDDKTVVLGRDSDIAKILMGISE